jgi:hypothetical protein
MSTTAALVAFSETLAELGIDPSVVEVSLPAADWKALDKQLAKEHSDGLFEGVGVTGEITVKGVRYLVRFG